MTREELKQAALSLPYEPGVYLMKNAAGTVIYVGKAKKLKNRVSQNFQDTAAHNAKTRKMVSNVDHFETIAAATEFEALVLECSLIKHYMPKYNILLKDDKGYPYLRVDLREDYPVITLATRVTDDGARYFGPYGSRGRTQQVIDFRDQRFRERMRPFIEKGGVAVFVGAAHMLRLRRMLTEDGFTVRQVRPTWIHRMRARLRGEDDLYRIPGDGDR